MTTNNPFLVYAGDGTSIKQRKVDCPLYRSSPAMDDPANYCAARGLRDAVNVAIALGQPLLVTGEAGTGKTQLASSVAFELGVAEPLVCNVKSTSTARDLFYHYDSIRHFHDAQFRDSNKELNSRDYIEFNGLGLAILSAMPPELAAPYLPEQLKGRGPCRLVVLIDEIDKAPRDLPNDVLNEIENMCFTVMETGQKFVAKPECKPIVILTSNSERTLPDAFLRRCVFYHLAFPNAEQLRYIVSRRLGGSGKFNPHIIEHAICHFEQIRELVMKKKPATAELLSWLKVIGEMQIDVNNLKDGEREALCFTYSLLAKTREDLQLLTGRLNAVDLQ